MGIIVLQIPPSDPEGIWVAKQYLSIGLFPINAPTYLVVGWNGKLPSSLWPELVEQHKTGSLRALAKEYGVSQETIRRTLELINIPERNLG